MSRTEIADTLTALHRLAARVAALELGIAAPRRGARGRHRDRCRRHLRLWANATLQTKRDAKRRLELAKPLDRDHEPVRDAMATGRVSEDQAVVIVQGVDALPVEHRRDAETHLIGCAAVHDPVALRRLAHHVLEVVAPEIAEAHELQALQRQEALAEEACRFTIADDGHGLCHGRFTLPAPSAPCSSRRCSRSTLPSTATTPAPRRGSGTRSASTSPATRSTGSPRPAAWTPPSWSR